jgi:hypothetical protein
MPTPETDANFDRWLDGAMGPELDRAVGNCSPPAPRYRVARNTPRRLRFAGLTSIPLALSLRMVSALAAAGLGVAGGTAALVASSHAASTGQEASLVASSHSSSSTSGAGNTSKPAPQGSHGAAVVSAVASCKAARPSPDASPKPSPGSRGIGACVSKVASGGKAGGSDDTSGDTDSGTHGEQTSHPTPPVAKPSHPAHT